MACKMTSVLSKNTMCQESPAGIGSYAMIIPLDNIASIALKTAPTGADPAEYAITAAQGQTLKGYEIDFKAQTGQVTSTSNGMGKGFSVTGTGRVELNEEGFSAMARLLNNFDYYIVAMNCGKDEWYIVGNEEGEVQFSNESDTGTERSGDHGHTFTFTCSYVKYPQIKFKGAIDQMDDDSE